MNAIIVALILATLTEAILEYVLGIWWKPLCDEARKRLILAVGLILGIGLAWFYKIDLIAFAANSVGVQMTPTLVGYILSGAIIGRGSTYLHDFWKKITEQ